MTSRTGEIFEGNFVYFRWSGQKAKILLQVFVRRASVFFSFYSYTDKCFIITTQHLKSIKSTAYAQLYYYFLSVLALSLSPKYCICPGTRLLYTAKNIVVSPNFLVWKFCGKAQFSHSFGQIVNNYAETVPFHKIFTPGNYVKIRYFTQFKK